MATFLQRPDIVVEKVYRYSGTLVKMNFIDREVSFWLAATVEKITSIQNSIKLVGSWFLDFC